jgi:hypothetical protein
LLLRRTLPVPVLDGLDCAIRQAELIAALATRKASAGSYNALEARASTDLASPSRRPSHARPPPPMLDRFVVAIADAVERRAASRPVNYFADVGYGST